MRAELCDKLHKTKTLRHQEKIKKKKEKKKFKIRNGEKKTQID